MSMKLANETDEREKIEIIFMCSFAYTLHITQFISLESNYKIGISIRRTFARNLHYK